MSLSEETASEESRGLPFDEAITEKFRKSITDLLLEHPELRSVSVALDYSGALNDAAIKSGLWLSEDGSPRNAAEIVGSIQQTLKILKVQFDRLSALEQAMRDELNVVGPELVRKKQELEKLDDSTQKERRGSDTN